MVNSFSVDGHNVVVFSDVNHLLKNIRNRFQDYNFIFSEATYEKFRETHGLVSRVISIDHIKALYDFQLARHLKYAPRVREKCFPKGSFEKMDVGPAIALLSRETAAALRILVRDHGFPPEFLTTALFCELVGRWYDIMSSRSSSYCFSLANEDKYDEVIQYLQDFVELFSQLTFATKSGEQQKPFQAGVKLSTKSMIDMCDYYLRVNSFHFLLGGRFTSDAIENFFSQVRRRNRAPTPMEFMRAFRALLILHHMKPAKHGSYMHDDTSNKWLTTLKDVRKVELAKAAELEAERANQDCDDMEVWEMIIGDKMVKDFAEECSLAHVIGYLLKKTICTKSKCADCQETFTMEKNNGADWQTLLIEKCYTPDALTFPSEVAYRIFSMCEASFLENVRNILLIDDFVDELVGQIYPKVIEAHPQIPQCHLKLLLKRFFKIRVHFLARQLTIQAKGSDIFQDLKRDAGYASKSMKGFQLR